MNVRHFRVKNPTLCTRSVSLNMLLRVRVPCSQAVSYAAPLVSLSFMTLNSVSPFSLDSSLSLRTCFPLMKNVSDTLAQRNAPWKMSARCMFFGGLASCEARRDPSIKMNATVNKLELSWGWQGHELVINFNGDMTHENHISAELPSVLRVISAASSRATGRRVKLQPPMIAMMAYKAPALWGLTAA